MKKSKSRSGSALSKQGTRRLTKLAKKVEQGRNFGMVATQMSGRIQKKAQRKANPSRRPSLKPKNR